MKTNYQATKSDYEEIETDSEIKEVVYTKKEISNDNRCAHVFRRISPTQVECRICHVGLYDDPTSELPIDALNEYYQDPKNQNYNRWL